MKKTIGVLGGMGPLATADLMAKIAKLTKASCDAEHIRVYVDSNPAIPDRTAAILDNGPDPVEEMTSALRHLEACIHNQRKTKTAKESQPRTGLPRQSRQGLPC